MSSGTRRWVPALAATPGMAAAAPAAPADDIALAAPVVMSSRQPDPSATAEEARLDAARADAERHRTYGPGVAGPENPAPTDSETPSSDRLIAHAYHLPAPTYWPAVLALGVTLIGMGIVTGLVLSAVGVVILVVGLIGWIGDLLRG